MSELTIFTIDSFTTKPFTGNPAAVCLCNYPLDGELMLNIAREMNLSETAFVVPIDGPDHKSASLFQLRWFTPAVEVPLCGHATLATAHVIFNELGNTNKLLTFETLKSGELYVTKAKDGLQMNFPQGKPEQTKIFEEILIPLGINKEDVVQMSYCNTLADLVIEVKTVETINQLKPDYGKLIKINDPEGINGVIVTAKDEREKYDFSSRYFVPWVGVDEDPVTGAIHTILGPYWVEKMGNRMFNAYQASERGGEMQLQLFEDRIILQGNAITMMKGEFKIDKN
jgi:PhzF family phenazine biosynthesis protein